MKGNGRKLSRKQQQAIAALLSHSTIEAAAKAIGITSVTMRRWLKSPQFQAEYRAARRQVVELAIARLQYITDTAVTTLTRNLKCGQPSIEVRAAMGILDRAIKAIEIFELEGRLTAVEERINEINGKIQ